MARLYQKINGEAVPLGGGGGGSVAIDNETITKNSDDEIQVATALTGKINQLDNVASDAGKVLTANGDGTADWENGYVEGFYGTTAEWDALTYAQKQAWVQKNPKVTFTDDYVSNIKQDVAGCISSTNENDVAGASALKEALTFSTDEKEIGLWIDNRKVYEISGETEITHASSSYPTPHTLSSLNFTGILDISVSMSEADGNHQVFPYYYSDTNNGYIWGNSSSLKAFGITWNIQAAKVCKFIWTVRYLKD